MTEPLDRRHIFTRGAALKGGDHSLDLQGPRLRAHAFGLGNQGDRIDPLLF